MPSINYQELARRIRAHVLDAIYRSGASHIGTAFSATELLAVLYGGVLRIDPVRPKDPDRDRFVLSKGHGCVALYAALAERGFFSTQWLEDYYQNGSRLFGHVTHTGVPGVEVSTGSLGHGLSVACGMAIVGKRKNRPYRVVALLSDGECDEGSTWEAVLFAGHHGLDNLVALIDYNKIQSLGRVDEVLDLEPLAAKWEAFGWAVQEIDGHDVNAIEAALIQIPFGPNQPSCVIAHTIKGKGVSFMEDRLLWHYRAPDAGEFERALRELRDSR